MDTNLLMRHLRASSIRRFFFARFSEVHMDKKKLRGYILILAVCVLASIVLPKLLDKAADKMVEGIDEETEVSTEKGGTGLSGVLGGFQENESET